MPIKKKYRIILYNNGKRTKFITSYMLYSNALKKYDQILKNNVVFFPREILWDGSKTHYELLLTAPKKNKGKTSFRNKLGALVMIKSKNFSIKKISDYQIEETFIDKLTGEKMNFKKLIKILISKKNKTPCLYLMNNKLYVEYFDSNTVNLYTLKSQNDASRLLETVKKFCITNKVTEILFFHEPVYDIKIKILDRLEKEYNIDRDYMARTSTR